MGGAILPHTVGGGRLLRWPCVAFGVGFLFCFLGARFGLKNFKGKTEKREEGRKGHCPVSSNILNKYTGLFRLTFVKMNKYEMTVGQNI